MRRFIHNSVVHSDTGHAASSGKLQRKTVSGCRRAFYAYRLVSVKISAVKYHQIKLAQSDRHQRGSQEVPGLIPLEVTFLLNLFFAFSYINLYCQLCIIKGKLSCFLWGIIHLRIECKVKEIFSKYIADVSRSQATFRAF